MTPEKFTYLHPITVRYGDLDPQGHVNNAVYLSYLESARLGYYEKSGIWTPTSTGTTGMVVVRIEIDYLAPIYFGQAVQVCLRMDRLGEKSLTFAFLIEALQDRQAFARGLSVMAAYDNKTGKSRPIPVEWRAKLNRFEGREGYNDIA